MFLHINLISSIFYSALRDNAELQEYAWTDQAVRQKCYEKISLI